MTVSGDWAVTKGVKAKWGHWGALAQHDGCPGEKRRTTHGHPGWDRPAEGLGGGASARQGEGLGGGVSARQGEPC